MNQPSTTPFSFAQLFDPAIAQATAERAAKWNLPRRVCRPLDRRVAITVSAEVAAYDASVENTEIEDESAELPLAA